MAKGNFKLDKFQKIYNDLLLYPTLAHVAAELGISERHVATQAKKISLGKDSNLVDRSKGSASVKMSSLQSAQSEVTRKLKIRNQELTKTVNALTAQLEDAHKDALSSSKLRELIHGMDVEYIGQPDWLNYRGKSGSNTGIPVLFLSDIHFDEVVNPCEIEYVNEYNREIATARIKHTFNTAFDLLCNKLVKPNFEGIVIALGGDLVSGNIHEELSETNDFPILKTLIELTDILVDGISAAADQFKKVYVPCVVGNHGRMHKKPRAKHYVVDNFEWIIYQSLARHFAGDDRVTFKIPEGTDTQFQVFDKTFLLTHGNQFKGGSGISGIFTPLMLGRSRKQQRQTAVRKPFDVMMCGHFHQYIHTDQLIINGSIKGYDEYAASMNFTFERPQQAMWINHPDHGMTMRMPILCDSNEIKKKEKSGGIKIW